MTDGALDALCALSIVALAYGLLFIIPIASWLHKRSGRK